MKNLFILVKKKPIRISRHLDISYMDETSELKAKYTGLDDSVLIKIVKGVFKDDQAAGRWKNHRTHGLGQVYGI
ncbi:MAG: hypothetical protein WAX69_00155 [Victivallales bacterium]